jgi:hypothetical protein
MRRLSPSQPVVLDLEEEAIECVVVTVEGDEATIAPLAAADASYIPTLGRGAALVFAPRGAKAGASARIRIRGAVQRGSVGARLRFTAGNEAHLPPRRQAARAGVAVPVELSVPGAADEPARRLSTSDVSLGGIGVRVGSWAPDEGALLAFGLELPAAPPIRGSARVLRVADGIAGLAITEIAPADRTRLAAMLIASRAA